jgi:exopolysaccharide biosynthesis polyprenyl glycosylphosphotransferase
MVKQLNLRFTLFLFFSDLVLALLALQLATRARYFIPVGNSLGSDGVGWEFPLPVYALTLFIITLTFVNLSVYDLRRISSLSRELLKVAEAALSSWLLLAGVLYFSYRDVSRLQFTYVLVFYMSFLITHRVMVRIVFVSRSNHRNHVRRILIVGTGEIARDLAELVRMRTWMGLSLEGFIGDPETRREDTGIEPLLGTLDQALDIVSEKKIDEVLIALPRKDFHITRGLIKILQELPVNIRLVPDYFDMAFLRLDFENFDGIPLLSLKEPVLDPFQRLTKRVFDLVIILMVLGPALVVMSIIAVLVRLDGRGPILFKQERVGEHRKTFIMFKFRTMFHEAERTEAPPSPPQLADANNIVIHKAIDDPRVTRLGRFLRRSSLDELPQLFNVLRGEMSLVGPRPEMPWLVNKYEPWQRKRFEVPQGLTGWWQINGRSERPMHLYTEDDLYYIQNYSLLLDIIILWRTVGAVLSRRGAY